jgi:hypothetical protein
MGERDEEGFLAPITLIPHHRATTHSTSQAHRNWPHNLVQVSKLCGQLRCALPALARGGSDDGGTKRG